MALSFSKAAEEDLIDIFTYGLNSFGLQQAERYKSQLAVSFQTISENPRIARLRREIDPPVRIFPSQRHMIVYEILDDTDSVLVLRVRHQGENWIADPTDGADVTRL